MAGFMMLGLAAAAVWPGAAGAALGAGLVAVGGAVKVPALVAIVYLGWRYDGRPAAWWVRAARVLALLAVALAVMQVLHVLTGLSWGWTSGLTAGSSVTTFLSTTTTVALLVRWLFVPLGVDKQTTLDAVRQLGQAIGFAIAAVLLWRTPVLGLVGLGGALFVSGPAGAVGPRLVLRVGHAGAGRRMGRDAGSGVRGGLDRARPRRPGPREAGCCATSASTRGSCCPPWRPSAPRGGG